MNSASPSHPRRILFAGSPEFAVVQLDALHQAGLPLVGVLSQPDRPTGRKRRLTPTPTKVRALELGLPVATPASLRRDEGRAAFEAFDADLLVVAAYGLILPPAVLEYPTLGCLNVHASLLPRWRGAAPVERAIMAGDDHSGVCIMTMEAGLDTGPVHLARSTPITLEDTGGSLEARLAHLGAEALLEVIAEPGAHPPRPQPEAGVTYAHKIEAADAAAAFSDGALAVARRIRALNPRRAVAVVSDAGLRLRLLQARVEDPDGSGTPGQVLGVDREGLRVQTARGTLLIPEVQLVGGKGARLSGPDLANALRTRLGAGSMLLDA